MYELINQSRKYRAVNDDDRQQEMIEIKEGIAIEIIESITLPITAKAVYAGYFKLVFEMCQLLESIDMNSWHSSKTSWKWPAQSAFSVSG